MGLHTMEEKQNEHSIASADAFILEGFLTQNSSFYCETKQLRRERFCGTAISLNSPRGSREHITEQGYQMVKREIPLPVM